MIESRDLKHDNKKTSTKKSQQARHGQTQTHTPTKDHKRHRNEKQGQKPKTTNKHKTGHNRRHTLGVVVSGFCCKSCFAVVEWLGGNSSSWFDKCCIGRTLVVVVVVIVVSVCGYRLKVGWKL